MSIVHSSMDLALIAVGAPAREVMAGSHCASPNVSKQGLTLVILFVIVEIF